MTPIIASSTGSAAPAIGAAVAIAIALIVRGRGGRGRPGSRRRVRVTLAVVAAIAVVGLIASLAVGGGKEPDTFASNHGKQARAGFLAGCRESLGRADACVCIFQRVTSKPPFDKPSGFEKVLPALTDAKTANDIPADLRNVLTRALIDCGAV